MLWLNQVCWKTLQCFDKYSGLINQHIKIQNNRKKETTRKFTDFLQGYLFNVD